MTKHPMIRHGAVGTALAAALAIGVTATPTTPASAKWHPPVRKATAKVAIVAPSTGNLVQLSISRGQMITLPRPMSDLFVADEKVADVQVRSPNQLYVFGKNMGETTLSATAKDGSVVYAATIRVGNNITGISQMLKTAMPEAQITSATMNGMVLLTGTVAAPDDVEEATRLVTAFVGPGYMVVNRIKTATPLQVMLKVRFSEVNRDIGKTIATNIIANSSHVDVAQGNVNSDITKIIKGAAGTSFFFSGALAGLDIFSSLDLAETDGYALTLAEPTLTALSGETASFLAGGEIPIPVPQFQGVTTIEYKTYGVSLAFTPTVLSDGRISLRVRPEVSQLTSSTVAINGYQIPGLTTRRAETTVELGSGQSFVIGGLLSNNSNNAIDKAPFLGDLPVIGQLFRSNNFKKSQSELVIIVTPYLVKPLNSERQVAMPTDGYRSPTDAQQVIMNRAMDGKTGTTRAIPVAAPPVTAPATGAPVASLPDADKPKAKPGDAAPGFSFN